VFNCNGVPDVQRDPGREIKLSALAAAVHGGTKEATEPCLFAILLETHTSSVADRISSTLGRE
jgi:hypothetical protein